MNTNTLPDAEKRIGSLLYDALKKVPNVIAVYLFGSYAEGRAKDTSDLDLAFLLDAKARKEDLTEDVGPVYTVSVQIGTKLGVQTDVTVLNDSSIEMAYEIVTQGRCIYDADSDRRLEYESRVKGMYFDFRPFLEKLRADTIARI